MDFTLFHHALKNDRTEKLLVNFFLVLICGSIYEIVDIRQTYITNSWLNVWFKLFYLLTYFFLVSQCSWTKFYCVLRQMLIIKLDFSSITGEVTKEESKNRNAFARTVGSQTPTLSSASCLWYRPVTEAQRKVWAEQGYGGTCFCWPLRNIFKSGRYLGML